MEALEDRTLPSLVAAFGFNEGAGAAVADTSGAGNHGTTTAATWSAAGKYGQALSFNGANSWVTIADAPSLDLTTGMTLEAWVQPTTINSWETVILKETTGELAYALYADNDAARPGAWIRQGNTSYSTIGTSQIPINAWTHLAATYDGAVLRLYVNGAQVSSLTRSGSINVTTGALRIGGNSVWSEWFNGLIDEVRIYNHALTQSEIQTDMNTPIADTTPPTIVSTAPAAGASGVASSANITVTFSEAMDPATISAATLELRDAGGSIVNGAVSYSAATLTATFDPDGNLTPGAEYTALVRGGAADPRVKDVAGNGLAADASWSFTVAPLSVSIGDATVTEGNNGTIDATFNVTLSAASSQAVSVTYSTADGTAAAGSDYTGVPATVLTFDPGETSKPITVTVLGDTAGEPNETFFVNLSSPTNAVLGDAQGTGLINDDDATVIGADGFGYVAMTRPFEAIDLVPGALGVFTIRSTGNNATTQVTLSNGASFNFYGTSFSTFWVSTNGLITFNSGYSSATNTDLTSGPSQRSIAPMWDDWINVSGQTMILGKYEDTDGDLANDRLIIEWNNVQGATTSPSPVTFQAILQLNTGTTLGDIIFNYPDLDSGNFRSDGGSATVGIKDIGTQGARRLLVSLNNSSSPYVGSGRAIRLARDPFAPTVSITDPADGAIVSGAISLAAAASDNIGVVGVQFLLDGVNLGAEDTTAPYTISWDTTAASNGFHTLTARARDAAGNTASTAVTVTVNNVPDTTDPTVSITAPADGAVVTGTISVSADAADDVGVTGVQFLLDGANLGVEDTSAPYSINWNTTTAAEGTHELTARARDAAGNVTTSAIVSVTVSNPDTTPPAVSMSAPANGAAVSGNVAVSANASDDIGVVGVQFLLDGNSLGAEDTSAPYSISWATTNTTNGSHTLSARARDAAGNVTTSSTITVSVSNASGVPLTINGNIQFQTMDGFGVNANVNSWDNGALAPALDMLTDELGASLFRVYIDNTDWEATNDDSDPFTFNWAYFNSVYTSPRLEELWSTMAYLNQKGVTSGLILNFMGPAPAWMGGSDLPANMEDEWVETIASLVYYARNTRNLSFTRLAPFNEPDWNGLEGMRADEFQLTRLLHKLSDRLDAIGLGDIRFVGPETAQADSAVTGYIPEMLSDPVVMAKVDDFAFHNYAGYTANANALINNSAYPDRDFWVTESSFGNAQDFAPADHLFTIVTQGATSTMVFKAYDGQDNHHPPGEDFPLGMLAYDSATQTYAPRKAFYQMMQVYKFVRPGALRISAAESNGNLTVHAFRDPASGRVTIVGRNSGGGNMTIAGSLQNLPGLSSFELYQTNLTSTSFQRGPDVTVTNGSFAVTVMGGSIFTLVTPADPDTTAPAVSITAPADGATVAGTIVVSAAASDDVGVAGVQFLLDGVDLGAEDTSSPFSVSWSTTTLANGSHTLTARARDAAGNWTLSPAVTVTVDNDVIAPTVVVTAPADGANLSGAVNVSADAGDNVGVAGVEFLLDDVPLGAEDTAAPYALSWDTATASNGSHVVKARARDAAGNITVSAGVSVTVFNTDTTPPAVSLTAPGDGATVTGNVVVSADASDNVGITGVQFLLDDAPLRAEDVSAPFVVTWDTATSTNGTHTLKAVARDAAGNIATSATVTVTVVIDTAAPAVSITNPADGATVSGTVAIAADASDDIGVVGVQFLLNGASLGAEDTAASYSINWNSTAVANGLYTLAARARDAAGKQTTSAPVTVTVNNAAPTGLVLALGFNEGAGTAVQDASGNGNHGAIAGAAWAAGGKFGAALSFDGVNDLVTIADAASLDLTTGMTMEAWINPNTINGWETVILKETNGELAYALYADNNGNDTGGPRRPGSWIRQGGASYYTLGTTQITINQWTHLAATYDGAVLRLYVNGVQAGSLSRTGSINTTSNPLRIGGNNVWSEWFNGLIDEVRIYNRALTQAEIQTDMNTPIGSPLHLLESSSAAAAAKPIAQEQVGPILDEAVRRWQELGLKPAAAQRLRQVSVQLIDLPRNLLGLASGTTVWIDVNAAGRGWFVDVTPWEDSEFTSSRLHKGARSGVDLLTVLAHELGHVLGRPDDYTADTTSGSVMAWALPAGVRRVHLEDAAAALASPALAARTPMQSLDALWGLYALEEDTVARRRNAIRYRVDQL